MDSNQTKSTESPNKENLSERDRHTVRFLEWVRTYSGWWYLICTPDEEHMNLDMMKNLIQRLTKEQFYEIIFVLLTVHRNAIDNVFKYMLLEMMVSGWKGEVNGKDKIIRDLADLLT